MNVKLSFVSNGLMTRFIKPFCFLFVTTSIAAFSLFYGVRLIGWNNLNDSPVIISDGYHWGHLREIADHPFVFLLTISFFVSLTGALWIAIIAPKYTRHHNLQVLVLPWIAMILTSPVWGVIWSINHWPPTELFRPCRNDALLSV